MEFAILFCLLLNIILTSVGLFFLTRVAIFLVNMTDMLKGSSKPEEEKPKPQSNLIDPGPARDYSDPRNLDPPYV